MIRKTYDERAEEIVRTGLKIALKIGIHEVTRNMIADEIGISRSLISYYFTIEKLEIEILKFAKDEGLLKKLADAAIRTSRRKILLK